MENKKGKNIWLYSIIMISLIIIPLISATSFTFLYPNPPNGEFVQIDFVEINISIFSDFPTKNCTLILEYDNKSWEGQMEIYNNYNCYRKISNLVNNTNYSLYIVSEDINGNISSSHKTSFFTSFEKRYCKWGFTSGVRGCITNLSESIWPGGSSESFLVFIIIIGGIVLILEYLNVGPSKLFH